MNYWTYVLSADRALLPMPQIWRFSLFSHLLLLLLHRWRFPPVLHKILKGMVPSLNGRRMAKTRPIITHTHHQDKATVPLASRMGWGRQIIQSPQPLDLHSPNERMPTLGRATNRPRPRPLVTKTGFRCLILLRTTLASNLPCPLVSKTDFHRLTLLRATLASILRATAPIRLASTAGAARD